MPLPFIIGACALGAAAIGGVAAHVAASNKNDEAEELLADAKYIYDREKEILLKAQRKTEASIMSLAQCKHKVLETSLKDFFYHFNFIKHVQPQYSNGIDEVLQFDIAPQDSIQIRELTNIYADTMSGVGAGVATGAAVALATGAGEAALAAASAAGGALATGSIGAAVGALSVTPVAAVAAAVAAPVMLFTGISSYFDAEENLSRAEATHAEASAAVEKMKYQETLCQGITDRSDMFNNLIVQLNGYFQPCVGLMAKVIEEKRKKRSLWAKLIGRSLKAEDFTLEEHNLFRVTRALAGATKAAIDIKILNQNGDVDDNVDSNYQAMKQQIPQLAHSANQVQSIDYFAPAAFRRNSVNPVPTKSLPPTSTDISDKFSKKKIGVAAIFVVVGLLCFGIAGLKGILGIIGMGLSVYMIDKMRHMDGSVTMNKPSVIASYVTSVPFFLVGFGSLFAGLFIAGVGFNFLGCVLHPATNKKTGFLVRHLIGAVLFVIVGMLSKIGL